MIKTTHMKSIWIIGGGRFGKRAATVLRTRHPASEITVIEKDIHTCRGLAKEAFRIECLEGIRYLKLHLKNIGTPDWIVPAIPLHVAYEWIRAKLSQDYDLHPLDIFTRLQTELPNQMTGGRGQLFVSNADFICPENCSEPDGICTVTGEPRPRILHKFLAQIHTEEFTSVVICSRQLAAGVGGYQPRSLFEALGKIKSAGRPVLLSTACRCHGISNLFAISQKQ
jgi:hypothetical protein